LTTSLYYFKAVVEYIHKGVVEYEKNYKRIN